MLHQLDEPRSPATEASMIVIAQCGCS